MVAEAKQSCWEKCRVALARGEGRGEVAWESRPGKPGVVWVEVRGELGYNHGGCVAWMLPGKAASLLGLGRGKWRGKR